MAYFSIPSSAPTSCYSRQRRAIAVLKPTTVSLFTMTSYNSDNSIPCNDRSGQFCSHNWPAAAVREVFKPSTDAASLLVPSQKTSSVLGLGFFWGDVTSVGVLAFLWPTLPGPGRQSNGPTCWPKYFLQTMLSYESLEPLVCFLAYLDQKLHHKNQKVVKISTPKKGNQGGITPLLYMAITRR